MRRRTRRRWLRDWRDFENPSSRGFSSSRRQPPRDEQRPKSPTTNTRTGTRPTQPCTHRTLFHLVPFDSSRRSTRRASVSVSLSSLEDAALGGGATASAAPNLAAVFSRIAATSSSSAARSMVNLRPYRCVPRSASNAADASRLVESSTKANPRWFPAEFGQSTRLERAEGVEEFLHVALRRLERDVAHDDFRGAESLRHLLRPARAAAGVVVRLSSGAHLELQRADPRVPRLASRAERSPRCRRGVEFHKAEPAGEVRAAGTLCVAMLAASTRPPAAAAARRKCARSAASEV